MSQVRSVAGSTGSPVEKLSTSNSQVDQSTQVRQSKFDVVGPLVYSGIMTDMVTNTGPLY